MKSSGRFRLLTFLLITLLISSAAVATFVRSTTHAHAASAPTGLHVVGNQIVDSGGHVIVPRGADRMGTEYACRAQDVTTNFDGPVDQASVNAMLSWDINAVRVPLNEDCWLGINGEPANGKTVTQYQTDIINWVNLLNQNGLIVILDLHWNNSGTNKALGQEPMPDLDHTPAFWTSVANTFKSNSSVIFDLYNEPYPGFTNGTTSATGWSCWKNGSTAASTSPCADVPFAVAGMQTLVNTVRATGATNILLLGGVAYANDLTGWLANEPTDPNNNLAASVHIYNFNACASTSCWASQIAPVAAKVPVIVGEIGESDCSHTFIDSLMNWLDTQNLGYLAWTWTVVSGYCGNILITDYTGTPTAFGVGLKNHLLALAAIGGPPPAISLTSPTTGQTFTSPATIPLAATAVARNGKTITKVEFYNGSTLIGTATTSPYTFNWTNVAANSYILTAKAYDSGGGTTVSAAAGVTVNAPGTTVIKCKLQYVMNAWDTGFSVNMTLTNTGTTTISGWTLTFSFSGNQQITQLWNGTLTQTGANVSIKDAGYNATIAAGGYTSLGFNGTYSGMNNPPTIFFVNNQICSNG